MQADVCPAGQLALALEAVRSKSSWSLVGKLRTRSDVTANPKSRTDNEVIFTSRVFALALFQISIDPEFAFWGMVAENVGMLELTP